ncbi:hypothetical protein QQP08_015813 [Theobroma cacao]|nr:hypothetical protein QQP08_015813 [Theobroma cacao]
MEVMAPMLSERQSIQWPLLFRKRIEMLIQSMDLNVWNIILDSPHVPYKEVDGKLVIKTRREWNDRDKKIIQINCKAYNTFFCTLGASEFNKVSMCENDKPKTESLETTHEGSNQVKESKIRLLTHDYELFKMRKGESINEMFERLTNIVEGLKALGKEFPNAQLEKKRNTKCASENEEDMAMLARKFNRFVKKTFRAKRPINGKGQAIQA